MADVHCTVRHWRLLLSSLLLLFFFNDTATTEIYTLSLHDALPILSTLRTRQARVFTVDVFALDFSDDLEDADRKSTRLNSSHSQISYAVFCLKKKKNKNVDRATQTCNYQDSEAVSHFWIIWTACLI